MATRTWLLTAFDPFLDRTTNHSIDVMEEVVKLNTDPTLQLHALIIPTEYDRCEPVLMAELARLQSTGIQVDGILSLGEGKEEFQIETQANNLNHSPAYSDNAGVIRTQQKIYTDHPDVIPLGFPTDRFPISKSMSPGFFVCNHLCARMAVAREKNTSIPVFGFIHVPRTDLTTQFSTRACAEAILKGLQAS